MSELWNEASRASQRFGDQALNYDHYRPHYPESVFDDIVTIAGVGPGAKAIEIGAGTGIATVPLVERGLAVTAIEPSAEMAAIAKTKLADRAHVFVGRFEDYQTDGPVPLVASFNAWHWLEPSVAVNRVAEFIEPNGYLSLIWTEVVSWGPRAFRGAPRRSLWRPLGQASRPRRWFPVTNSQGRSVRRLSSSSSPIRTEPRCRHLRGSHEDLRRTPHGGAVRSDCEGDQRGIRCRQEGRGCQSLFIEAAVTKG